MALILLAWAVYLASPLAVVLYALFVLCLSRFQIQPEERALSALFGPECGEYLRQVRRWL
jgi:protein-S-isoprenylcysteine O-methyltransferase Ste14